MDLATQLRTTSDTLLQALDRLAELETEKRQLQPGDPRLVELARTVERISNEITGLTGAQREMTETENALVSAGSASAPTHSIEDTTRPLAVVLEEWRRTERDLEALPEDSDERQRLRARSQELKAEYRRGFEGKLSSDAPRTN